MSTAISHISRLLYQSFMVGFEFLNIPSDLVASIFRQHPPYWKDWQKFTKNPRGIRWRANEKWGPIFTETDCRGHYLTTLVLNRVPAGPLQALLPKGLELRPDSDGNHPVVYAFGFMENCIPDWIPLPGMNYLEMMVSIPNVFLTSASTGYTGPFLYMPSLHLNHIYPCILGWMSGYNKHWSRVQTTEDSYRVGTLLRNRKIVQAEFQRRGQPGKPDDFKAFEPWKALANQPAVTDLFGELLFVFLYWEWEHAVMQGVSAEIMPPQDARYRVPGLDYGHWPGIDEGQQIGACRIDVPFQWAPAFDRLELKGTMASAARKTTAAGG
jgi:hypothetical protein